MYAISATGYRALGEDRELHQGEVLSDTVPESMTRLIDKMEARTKRDILLRESDWTQVPDSNISTQLRSAFIVYRQALRDIPQHPDFPDMPWPSMPTVPVEVGDERPEES